MRIIEPILIVENMQQAKDILKKHGVDTNNENFIRLRDLLKNDPGFIGKFTKYMFEEGKSFEDIESVYKEMKMIGGLDKPIDSKIMKNVHGEDKKVELFPTLESLYDYIIAHGSKKKAHQAIKLLPNETERLINDKILDFIRANIDYVDAIKNFFKTKAVSCKTSDALFQNIKKVVADVKNWSINAIEKKIDDINKKDPGSVEIVAKSDDLLFVIVRTFDASQKIGDVSWCISRNAGQYNSYVDSFKEQFFVYDFSKEIDDKKHMMGLTLYSDNSIRAAHWGCNDEAVQNPQKEVNNYGDRMNYYMKNSRKKIVRESITEEFDTAETEVEPITIPKTPTIPKRPTPIRRDKPSVIPRPKATEKEVSKRYMKLIGKIK